MAYNLTLSPACYPIKNIYLNLTGGGGGGGCWNSHSAKPLHTKSLLFFVVFVALRPMSTAMVIAGRSVHLTTLFPGQA